MRHNGGLFFQRSVYLPFITNNELLNHKSKVTLQKIKIIFSNTKLMKTNLIFLLCLLLSMSTGAFGSDNKQLAFPTAEGYGKYTIGGRGGKVIHVTNLNDDGAGSLRAAINEAGPRTIVFDVSGTIMLKSNIGIKNPYITIAGQTAPGDGICLRGGNLNIGADNVIIRHIRIRVGDELEGDYDALECRGRKNVIIDHVSASWSVDETMSLYGCDNITVQWCMITESMFYSHHVKGSHGFGGIWGSNYSTYHHNLIAHHSSRNPRIASNCGYMDYRNNVIYNWGYNSCYGGEKHDPYNPTDADVSYINMVNNYYKPGPATQPGNVAYRIANPSYRDVFTDYGKWYVAGNYMVGNAAVTANNWNGGIQCDGAQSFYKADTPWDAMPINQQTAEEAYQLVLANAGATFPKRDVIDQRICNETRDGYATYEGKEYKLAKKVTDTSKKCGIIDSQNDTEGWPVLESAAPAVDTDCDGMPDEWELKNKLDPNDPNDHKRMHTSGYTALEVYLNELCGEIVEGEFVKKPVVGGEPASVYWRMESDNVAAVEGQIIAIDETFSGLKLDRYTAPNSSSTVWPAYTGYDTTRKTQRVGIIDGAWPGEEAYVADRYIQFGVKANSNNRLHVEKISLFLCGCGTGGMQCNVLYDTNKNFSNPKMIGDFSKKEALPNSYMQDVVAETDLNLEPGESVFLRVYPWSKGALTNKTICVSDIRFEAKSTSITKIETVGQDDQIAGIFSIDGVRRNEYTGGINIVRSAGKTVKVMKR